MFEWCAKTGSILNGKVQFLAILIFVRWSIIISKINIFYQSFDDRSNGKKLQDRRYCFLFSFDWNWLKLSSSLKYEFSLHFELSEIRDVIIGWLTVIYLLLSKLKTELHYVFNNDNYPTLKETCVINLLRCLELSYFDNLFIIFIFRSPVNCPLNE